MREIRTSGSMRGRRKRAVTYRACVLLYDRRPYADQTRISERGALTP
jgi:hypothetical protein